MRLLTALIYFWLASGIAYSQCITDSELFKVGEELIVRDGVRFLWQNNDELIYLGSLKRLPGNGTIESFECRSDLLNALIQDFLTGVLVKAQQLGRDSIFDDGFIIERGVTAVGVQYESGKPYTVYVGQRIVNSTQSGGSNTPQTLDQLMEGLASYLNETEGTATFRFEKELIRTSGEFANVRAEYYRIMGSREMVLQIVYAEYPEYDPRIQNILTKSDNSEFSTFLKHLLDNQTEYVSYWESGSNHVNSGFHLSSISYVTYLDSQEAIAALSSNEQTEVTVEKDTVTISNLEMAKERGQYQFIADFLLREIQHPLDNREILYMGAGEPIFVQDSVLDYYANGRFNRVLDKPINSAYQDFILPELLHRVKRDMQTSIAGEIELVSDRVIAYQFKDEVYSVVADGNSSSVNYYFIIGWRAADDKPGLLKLLVDYKIPTREPIQIKQIDNKLLLITPAIDGLKVDLWNPDENKRKTLARLPLTLTDKQREMALTAIVERYESNPDDCNPNIHEPELHADANHLIISFSDNKEKLFLYSLNSNIRQVELEGSSYQKKWKILYQDVMSREDFQGSLKVLNIDGSPVVFDNELNVWFLSGQSLVKLITFDKRRKNTFLTQKLLKTLIDSYSRWQEPAVLKHWASDSSYIALHYPGADVRGLVSNTPISTPFLQIEGYDGFEVKEQFTNGLIRKYAEEAVDQSVTIRGTPTDEAWLITLGEKHYLYGQKLNKIHWLGEGFLSRENQAQLLAHLASLVSEYSIKPEIASMKLINGGQVFAFRLEPKTIRFLSDASENSQVLYGDLKQSIYFEEDNFLQALLSNFSSQDSLGTSVFSSTRVTETSNRIAIWDDQSNRLHEPVSSFPSYDQGQRTTIINILVSLFKLNPGFAIKPSNTISTKDAYGIYDAENQTWYYVPKLNNDTPIRVTEVEEQLDRRIVDRLLENAKDGSKIYQYSSEGEVSFFLRSDGQLNRVYIQSGVANWHPPLGNIKDISTERLPGLYEALIKWLAGHLPVEELSEFEYFELENNDVAVWLSESGDRFQTIVVQKPDSEVAIFEQKHHSYIQDNELFLDVYFSELSDMSDPMAIRVLRVDDRFKSFYNPEGNRWFIRVNPGDIKENHLDYATFGAILSSDNKAMKALLVKTLFRFHSDKPKIHFTMQGFYFYKGNQLIFNRKAEPNKVYAVDTTALKERIRNNIQNPLQKFNATNLDQVVSKIFDCIINDGNFYTKFNLQGPERVSLELTEL